MPIWNAQESVLKTYSCAVYDRHDRPCRVSGGADDLPLLLAYDSLILSKALKTLKSKDGAYNLNCPVHCRTIMEPESWDGYGLLCERILDTGIKSRVSFEIRGVAPETEFSALLDCAQKLEPFCRTVAITVPYNDMDDDYTRFHSGPFGAINVDVGHFKGHEGGLLRKLDNFAERAEKVHLKPSVSGVQSLSQIVSAIGSGFSMVSGDAAHPAVESPRDACRYGVSDVLARIAG